MAELKKVENNIFKEYYEGRNDGRRVICILDLNCVRYYRAANLQMEKKAFVLKMLQKR